MSLDSCPVCSASGKGVFEAKYFPDVKTPYGDFRCSCGICGTFLISEQAAKGKIQTELKGKTHLLSGVLRHSSEKGITQKILDIEAAKSLVQSAPQAERFQEKINRLLLHIADKSEDYASLVRVDAHDYPILYLRSSAELRMLLDNLYKMNYLDKRETKGNRLGIKGWETVDLLRHSMPLSDQAFVAMWFDPQMNEAFDRGIRPALRATGYNPLRIDLEEFNDDICDKIRGEIRRSAFVVADFTGNRPGVYFEAGFGMGLGLPVIWTCRKDWMEKVHFDTNHYSHIVWSEPEELRKRLENRIRATLPLRPPLPENGKDQ